MSFCGDLTRAIQTRLAELGWYQGFMDGQHGPLTSSAIVRFKQAHGLRARDFVGPLTLSTLFGSDARTYEPPRPKAGEPAWLAEARSWIGTREVPGPRNNPEIMRWAQDLDQWYPGDDLPWCGLFVAHCMAIGAPQEPQSFNRLGARAWRGFGQAAFDDTVPLGGVAVLWRTHKTKSVNGHVFIINGQSSDAVRGIGGNQSDAVSERWFSRDRILDVRVPSGATLPPAPFASTGIMSRNEQ